VVLRGTAIDAFQPGRVSQIERNEVATVEALATYVAALGGKLELVAEIGGHLLKMPPTQRLELAAVANTKGRVAEARESEQSGDVV